MDNKLIGETVRLNLSLHPLLFFLKSDFLAQNKTTLKNIVDDEKYFFLFLDITL